MEKLLSGNEAIAEGAIYAGCRFFAGYPITPSSDLAERMSFRLPQVGGRFIQMEDEIASAGAIIGASLCGIKSMTATSGPGFSLMQEHISFAAMAEVPIVIANIQRGGPSTGLPTFPSQQDMMQARWGAHGDYEAITLVPCSVEECFYLTVKAFNLSEKYRVPAFILSDEVIAHLREKVRIPEPGEIEVIDREKPRVPPEQYYPYDDSQGEVPPLAAFGSGYRYHVTGLAHDITGFPTHDPEKVGRLLKRIVDKIRNHVSEIVEYEEYMVEDADILVFSYGCTSRACKEAIQELRRDGVRVGLWRPKVIWPFPEEELKKAASGKKAVLVVEMNYKQIGYEVERILCDMRVHWMGRADGEIIPPEEIEEEVKCILTS